MLCSAWLKRNGPLEGAHIIIPATLTTCDRSGSGLEFGTVWHGATGEIYLDMGLRKIVVRPKEVISESEMHRANVGLNPPRLFQGGLCQSAVISRPILNRRYLPCSIKNIVSLCQLTVSEHKFRIALHRLIQKRNPLLRHRCPFGGVFYQHIDSLSAKVKIIGAQIGGRRLV